MRHPLSTTAASGGLCDPVKRAVAVSGVDGFVVENAFMQAVPQDLEPTIPERPERGVMSLATGSLGVIELRVPTPIV